MEPRRSTAQRKLLTVGLVRAEALGIARVCRCDRFRSVHLNHVGFVSDALICTVNAYGGSKTVSDTSM